MKYTFAIGAEKRDMIAALVNVDTNPDRLILAAFNKMNQVWYTVLCHVGILGLVMGTEILPIIQNLDGQHGIFNHRREGIV